MLIGCARTSLSRLLLPTAATLVVLAGPAPVRAEDDHKRVLVIYANRSDSQFSILAETDLPRMIEKELGRNLDYYSEFMDVARFPDSIYESAFAEFLSRKYRDVQFDLVVAMHDTALEFVNTRREQLFPGAPVVFFSDGPAIPVGPDMTGLVVKRNFVATVKLIERLQPDATNVFIVTGAGDSDRTYERDVREQLRAAGSRLSFTYLSGLPTVDLERKLSTLPRRSAVYYVLVTEDGAGDKFHPLQYVDRVAVAANAPTYCWVDSAISHRIVGGSLYSQRDAIEQVGQLALRVLRGERPGSIPATVVDLNTNVIDWQQLKRWRIDEARVPQDATVMFREPTMWDRYKFYVLAALVLLVAQTVLIAGLLIQRARRRQAEERLRGREIELRASYQRIRDLGARLLDAQETERSRIARDLHDDISQQMALLAMDLALLRGASGQSENGRVAADALARAEGIARSIHDLSHRLHPARLRLIGLVAALDQLRLELSHAGIAIAFTHDTVPSRLAPDLMLCVFRIAQEALQNAIKYSHADALSMNVTGAPGVVTLTVTDNGSGFDVESAWGKGLGLISMRERLEAIGGSLEIRSTPGTGTRLTAVVPLLAAQQADAISSGNVLANPAMEFNEDGVARDAV